MKICGQSHLHTEAKELSGAMGQGRTELFLHLVSPRATSQEIQLLDGPPRSNSHFQRDPHCVYTYTYTYTCILFPNKRLSSWTRPLVVLVSAVCSACVSLCAWHKYVCAVGAVCKCAWWEKTLSLTPGETWKCRPLLDYYTSQPMTETVVFHLQRSEIAPATVRFSTRLLLKCDDSKSLLICILQMWF